jgi:UDP-galactopyranose mutase
MALISPRRNLAASRRALYVIVISCAATVCVFLQLRSSSNNLNDIQLPPYTDYERAYRDAKFVEIGDSSENVLPPGCDYAKTKLDYSKKYDTCVIGAGLSGTVFAERTANMLKRNVLVIDSRPHIGGNCYDFIDQKTGILRNQYGSHLFHTKIERVWDYITSNPKAPKWVPWYHQKFGRINGSLYEGMLNGTFYVPIPVNILTVNRLFGLNIQTNDEMNEWLKQVQIPCPPEGCRNAEEMAKSRVGEALYEAIFETYTIKQWNRSPKDMNASVTARIPVRSDFDPRYFADKWQALPSKGYTAWFEAMLDHPLIDVVLETDFFHHQKHLEGPACQTIVYTGPVDRYFADQGMEKLQYRSITFTEERHYHTPGYILPTPVLNYPGPETPFTRAIEYKHYLHQSSPHSIVVKETTSDEGEPYYPIPNPRNMALYEQYKRMTEELERKGKFVFVGRLANYKYFDMDKALQNALELFDKHARKTASLGPFEGPVGKKM